MNYTVGNIADILSIISGTMTILGIGGVLSWSLLKGRSSQISNNILGVFSYALKIGICLLIGVAFIALAAGTISTLEYGLLPVVLSYLPTYDFYNYDVTVRIPARWISEPMCLLILLPTYLLSCASVFSWSLEPWKRFFSIFKHDPSTGN